MAGSSIRYLYPQAQWAFLHIFGDESTKPALAEIVDLFLPGREGLNLQDIKTTYDQVYWELIKLVAARADRSHLTATQNEAFEWSRLNYLGVRAAYITAYENGVQKYTLNEKERTALELHKIGMPVERIAAVTQLPLERVQAIVAGFER